MEILELSKWISEEQKAIEYLRKKKVLKDFKSCPHCKKRKLWETKRFTYKCSFCLKEWSIRTDSILSGWRISIAKFLTAIKLFEMETTALKVSKEIKISYMTTLKLLKLFRKKIISLKIKKDFDGEIELDESYFGGKNKGNKGRKVKTKIPVFGILERNGRVHLEVVKGVDKKTLLGLTIKKVKRGSLIYTDCFKSYNGLVSYGFKHERINKTKTFANGKVYVNGIEGFWSYAKGRLLKYHGVGKDNFIYYLKELEFRYNNRKNNLFDDIIDKLNYKKN